MVTVWNEEQKREAVTLHGIDPARVEVTGRQLFESLVRAQAEPGDGNSSARWSACPPIGRSFSTRFIRVYRPVRE
jgi:hypothetical protein